MSGETAKQLRKLASFKISHDPEVRASEQYKQAKADYKALKRAYKY